MIGEVITYKSTNNLNTILLKLEYITRIDRSVFKLSINGSTLAERFFSNSAVWSSDSRYFAIQEWIEPCEIADYPGAYPFNNALVVFDFIQGKQCQLIKISGGNIVPIFFESSKIIYTKEILLGLIKEYEIDLDKLDRWSEIR